jgi:hypothetical protein
MTVEEARQWVADMALASGDPRGQDLRAAFGVVMRALDIAQASLDWVDDIGECHFCALTDGAGHEADCPVQALLAALK